MINRLTTGALFISFLQFTRRQPTESVILSLIGGLSGIIFGISASWLITYPTWD